MTQAEKEESLRAFEGLVKSTAQQIVEAGVELDYDDVAQILRIKVWYAVEKFCEERSAHMQPKNRNGRTPLERFVYGAVANMRKDIEKRPRRYNTSIERIRDQSSADEVSDWFDLRYLCADHDDVYAEVEEEPPPLPSTLTEIERRVVELRIEGRLLVEIDLELGLSRGERERVMRSVREKLADWHPSASERRSGPTPPLPGGAPRSSGARTPLAA